MDDTICAISTPIGEGGIGIVRISGRYSLKIAKRIFRSKNKLVSHKLVYGKIIDPSSNCIIDEALLVFMKKPKTYTREDIIEINVHSGFAILSEVLSLVLKEGARLAEPGEFTKRAYLSGRIDLIQAEAVEKIISSKTELARKISTRELQGELSLKIRNIRENLISILSLIEASLDFEEELDKERLFKEVFSIKKELKTFVEGYKTGRFLSNSAIGVIIGRPNVGKSSILNAIVGTDRAIVTPIPGTTRDVISEIINIKGIPFKIVDTAGLCDAIDIIEKEGIKRVYKAIESADIVIYVLDATGFITKDDISIFEKIKNKNVIFAINKSDLLQRIKTDILKKYKKPIVSISAKNKQLSSLLDEIEKALFSSYDEAHIITNIRHKEVIERALKHLDRAISSKEDEITSIELRASCDAISEILGEKISNEDILDKIFSTFCIGK
ncbi:MAG: tRNA uridine-5-carboxymethylaminomethyl(34) synthesis GTPase MnmE [bacterium]